jgi:hypothetical protein
LAIAARCIKSDHWPPELIGTATDPHMNEPEFRLDFTLKAGLPPSKKLQNTTEESSLEAVTK